MAEQNQNPLEKRTQPGRPPVLDEKKQRQLIALLAHGITRHSAARIVGCAASTIGRTADRDPDFADRLEAAEHRLEIEVLQCLQNAAKIPRHWRAGAWLLERRYPRQYAPQTPATLSEQDVVNMTVRLSQPLLDQMSAEELDKFFDRVYDMARVFYKSNELADYLPIPPLPKRPYFARRPDSPNPNPLTDDQFHEHHNSEADSAEDCSNFRPSENGTVPFDAPASPDSFATANRQERGDSQESPSPEVLSAEWLRAQETAPLSPQI